MAIKNDAQRKARTIEGKPVGEWFDSAAQRQKRDNKYASYDAPMRRPLPEDPATKAKEAASDAADERTYNIAMAAGRPGITERLATPSAHAKGKGMGISAIADARNEGIKASRRQSRGSSFPARPAEKTKDDKPRAIDTYLSKPGNTSVMSMPSGNADVEAAKKKRVADAKAKEERRKKDVAMNVGRTPYMANKYRPISL